MKPKHINNTYEQMINDAFKSSMLKADNSQSYNAATETIDGIPVTFRTTDPQRPDNINFTLGLTTVNFRKELTPGWYMQLEDGVIIYGVAGKVNKVYILGVAGLKKDIAKYVDRGTAPKGFEAVLPDGSLAINPVRAGDNGGSYYLLSPKFVEGKPYCRVLESSLDNLNLAELVKEVI